MEVPLRCIALGALGIPSVYVHVETFCECLREASTRRAQGRAQRSARVFNNHGCLFGGQAQVIGDNAKVNRACVGEVVIITIEGPIHIEDEPPWCCGRIGDNPVFWRRCRDFLLARRTGREGLHKGGAFEQERGGKASGILRTYLASSSSTAMAVLRRMSDSLQP